MGFSTSFERARNWYLNPDEIYQLIYKFWILLGVVSSLWGWKLMWSSVCGYVCFGNIVCCRIEIIIY